MGDERNAYFSACRASRGLALSSWYSFYNILSHLQQQLPCYTAEWSFVKFFEKLSNFHKFYGKSRLESAVDVAFILKPAMEPPNDRVPMLFDST